MILNNQKLKKYFLKTAGVLLLFSFCFYLGVSQINNAKAQKPADVLGGLENAAKAGGIQTAETRPEVMVGQIIRSFLGVLGIVALVLIIYGGFLWMTAAGNEEKVKKGKAVLTWAVIGLIVIFGSYAITDFVVSKVITAVGVQ